MQYSFLISPGIIPPPPSKLYDVDPPPPTKLEAYSFYDEKSPRVNLSCASLCCLPQVGDRVAVMRKGDGTLHFYVNGIDQGPAASNVPANVYGVIDLYGQAAQATICDMSGKGDYSGM